MKPGTPSVYVNTDPLPDCVANSALKYAQSAQSTTTATPNVNKMRLAVKDLFHIQGIPTSAGNPCWLRTHEVPVKTNQTVSTLLLNGAEYQGKTLTDELAYSLNGQNVHYPPVVNPITPERLAGGSSSGSAVAVAAGLADIGLGTDTGGSIRVPASYNGIFGLRTTHGRISCDNMVALAPSFDTIGWMCRSLEDMSKVTKLLLNEHDKGEHMSRSNNDQLRVLALQNLISQAEHATLITNWLQTLKEQSEHIVIDDNFGDASLNLSETFRVLQGFEIWQQHGQWIQQTKPILADDVKSRFQWCSEITQEDVEVALQQKSVIVNGINSLLARSDLLVLPTTPGRAPLLSTAPEALGEYRNNLIAFTAIAGLAGLPQLHLPLFSISGAPVGLSIIGPKNSDLSLLSMAKQLMMITT